MGNYLTKYDLQKFPITEENPAITFNTQSRKACYSQINYELNSLLKKLSSGKIIYDNVLDFQIYLIIALPKSYPKEDENYTHREEFYKIENFKRWAEILKENLDLDIEFIEKDVEVFYKVNLTTYLHEYQLNQTFFNEEKQVAIQAFLVIITTIIRYSYECILDSEPKLKCLHIVDNYELNKEFINKANFLYFIMYNILYNDSQRINSGHTFGINNSSKYILWKYTGKSLLSKLFIAEKLKPLAALNSAGNITFLATGLISLELNKNNLSSNPNHFYKTSLDLKDKTFKNFKEFYNYILNIKQNG